MYDQTLLHVSTKFDKNRSNGFDRRLKKTFRGTGPFFERAVTVTHMVRLPPVTVILNTTQIELH